MNLGIIGCGAIGSDVVKAASALKEIKKIYLYDKNKDAAQKLCNKIKKAEILAVDEFLKDVDVVFEGASQKAVYEYAEQILDAGKDLILMSVGSLIDAEFRRRLEKLAHEKRCKIYIPSGAICGIDGILSAAISQLDEVTLVTTKPPEAFGKSVKKRTVLFDGVASEAVQQFPSNINVAASLSLAGRGFDKTKVEIVADPVVSRISHKILAHGTFGRLRVELENMPNPNNPGSSYMASLSAIATLRRIIDPIQIGV
jgi:aspartate dehydrogenase